MVTPCYWGSHWPLARGNSTGNSIDDRIQFTPTHNSVMSWAGKRPVPLSTSELVTLDTLGRSRPMIVRRWAWLIGTSDAADGRLVDWAKSFATPPSLLLTRRPDRVRRIRSRAAGDPPGACERRPDHDQAAGALREPCLRARRRPAG